MRWRVPPRRWAADRVTTLALHRRRHRLHVRPGVQAGRRVAEDHAALDHAQHRLRQRRDARRDRAQPRRAARRRRLSAVGPAAQRAVRQRRARVEPGGHDRDAGAALRRRPHAPALDHAARRAEGGACAHGARGAAGDGRREPRSRSPSRAASAPPPSSTPTAWCAGSNRPSPDPVLGDTPRGHHLRRTTATIGGVKFPMRIRQSLGGYPVLDLTVKEVQANPRWRCACPTRRATPPSA